MNELDIIKEKERALSLESKTDKFITLIEVIRLTESSNLPVGIKEKIVKNLEIQQLKAVDLI